MKRIVPALGALLLLAACTPAENAASVTTPATTPALEPTTAPESTASPTAAPVEETTVPETTLEEWVSVMPEQKPDYTVTEGTLELQEGVAWPEQPVTLQIYGWSGTLEEAAEAYGVPLETLQALNPDPEMWERDGTTIYYNLKLQEDYQVPRPAVKHVTISTPWVASRWEQTASYTVPAALNDQAAACMASAYDFQYKHYGMSGGIFPADYNEETGCYCTTEGGLYTRYSDLAQYLGAVYTQRACEPILGGPQSTWPGAFYYQGEDDTILFVSGDRGSMIQYCGSSFTEPELQPDGSIEFWQLSLTVESDEFAGWGQGITYTPDTASVSIVRLEPSENGWRVAELSLPN